MRDPKNLKTALEYHSGIGGELSHNCYDCNKKISYHRYYHYGICIKCNMHKMFK